MATTARPKMRVRKNDTVLVIAGRDRGKRGRVLGVNPDTRRLVVEGVSIVKRHTKPNPQKNIKGGIVEKEGTIHVSNVMVVDPETNTPTRIGVRVLESGKKVRISRKSGAVVDR